MKPRELAAAIRKGHAMIDESRMNFLSDKFIGRDCGCALGAAIVGAGFKKRDIEVGKHANNRMAVAQIARVLGIPYPLAEEINTRHFSGEQPRLCIADWLDTLEPETKPADKQTFEDFKRVMLAPVSTDELTA